MQISKNKTMAIIIATILVSSLAISISALSTVSAIGPHPIPGYPNDSYNDATYAAIQQGMNWPSSMADANASANRILFWTRFQDKVPTHVFIITAPNPIGIGQADNIVMFNPQVPLNSGGSITAGFTLRYYYTFQVVKPDGTVQNYPTATPPSYSSWSQNEVVTYNGQTVFGSDSTGSTYMTYTPDTVGNYTFTVTFLQQQVNYNSTQGVSNDWTGITLLKSTYTTTLVVQQQPVSLTGLTEPAYNPVPTSYWSRPIEQENTLWYAIASNWLADTHDFNNGGSQNAFQADGTAPNSAHILWTTPEEDSGVLGGSNTGRLGNTFNTGSQYQPRLTPPIYGAMGPIIMYGRLYYSPNLYTSGYSELFNAIDLKTGQFLYTVNTTAITGARNLPSFGYYYSQDDINEHGIQNPGWLFTANYGVGYQPQYGYAELHLVNAPTSYEIQGPAGENLRYSAVNVGNAITGPMYNLLQWNSSKVIPMISSGATPSTTLYEANVPITPRPVQGSPNSYWNGTAWSTSSNVTALGAGLSSNPSYDWNISMPTQFNSVATGSMTVAGVKLGNFLWGYNGSWPTGTSAPSYTYPDSVTVWAINLALDSNGQPKGNLMYMTNIQVDTGNPDNQNILYEHADPNEDIFVGIEVPSQTYFVWNMTTGVLMWQSDSQSASISPFGYYTWPSLISGTQVKTAYGMLYTGGYSGSVSAYRISDGTLVWRYEVIPPGTAGVIKSSPGMMAGIAGGIVYIGCHEHSAETPLEPGNKVRALNATTGQLLWQMSGWAYPSTFAVADGVMIYLNNYDEQIYAVAQGPTQLTVTAPDTATSVGTPLIIRGTVMDISPGTQQTTVKMNFPSGLPAVSEDSMGQWMEYVYMQKTKPINATGVPVSLDAVDSNGNFRHIGDTTSDASGMFTFAYTPDIQGSYTVIATFAGSNGYYGSSSETSFYATAVHPTATPPTTEKVDLSTTQTYIIGIGIAIIIVIVIVGALIMMSLRKRP
jgi:hypothetical protein